jgi:subtilisin family serine protease
MQKKVKKQGGVNLQNKKIAILKKIAVIILICILPLNSIMAEPLNKEQKTQYKTDRYIIKYKDGKEGSIKANETIKKVKRIKNKNNTKLNIIQTEKKMTIEEIQKKLNSKEEIEYIQPDYQINLMSSDPYLNYQWGIYNQEEIQTTKYDETVGENVYEEITYRIDANVKPAWEETKGEGITIAIIDTGIDITHEDLEQNIWTNQNEIEGNNIDDDGNGYIDDINGWNFKEQTNQTYDQNTITNEWHGTHIAGIIAGQKDNQKGIAGIAPEAKIMVLKTFSQGTAYTSDIIEAINYAEENGANIINCSFGTSEENPALEETIKNSELLIIAAAGNNNINIDQNPVYPASYNYQNVIAVASINQKGTLSAYSNYGKNTIEITAPGETILSTIPENQYGYSSGTSMAAAYITGQAALTLSKNKTNTSQQTKQTILSTTDRLSTVQETVYRGNKTNCENSIYQLNINTTEIINIPEDETVQQAVYENVYQLGTYQLLIIDYTSLTENIKQQTEMLEELLKETTLVRQIIQTINEQAEQTLETNIEQIENNKKIIQMLLRELQCIKQKIVKKEQTLETNIEQIKQNSQKLQMLLRELQALNQIIIAKEKTTTINIEQKKEINLIFTGENIKQTSEQLNYTITYNPQDLEVTDLCGITIEKEMTQVQIPEIGIEITEYNPTEGEIKYTINKTIEEGKMWSGIINSIKFKITETTTNTQTEINTEIKNN